MTPTLSLWPLCVNFEKKVNPLLFFWLPRILILISCVFAPVECHKYCNIHPSYCNTNIWHKYCYIAARSYRILSRTTHNSCHCMHYISSTCNNLAFLIYHDVKIHIYFLSYIYSSVLPLITIAKS